MEDADGSNHSLLVLEKIYFCIITYMLPHEQMCACDRMLYFFARGGLSMRQRPTKPKLRSSFLEALPACASK